MKNYRKDLSQKRSRKEKGNKALSLQGGKGMAG